MLAHRFFIAILLAGSFIVARTAFAQQPAASAPLHKQAKEAERGSKQIEVVEIGTVHSLPSPMLDVLGSVTPGEKFTVYATSGPDWYKIDFHGKTGYIPRAICKMATRMSQPPRASDGVRVRETPTPQPATADKTVAASKLASKPAVAKSTKPVAPGAEKPAEQILESENTEPVSVEPPMEVTEDAEAIQVEAESGSHLMIWLIVGAVVFVGLIFLLIHFERPEESANDFIHHHPR